MSVYTFWDEQAQYLFTSNVPLFPASGMPGLPQSRPTSSSRMPLHIPQWYQKDFPALGFYPTNPFKLRGTIFGSLYYQDKRLIKPVDVRSDGKGWQTQHAAEWGVMEDFLIVCCRHLDVVARMHVGAGRDLDGHIPSTTGYLNIYDVAQDAVDREVKARRHLTYLLAVLSWYIFCMRRRGPTNWYERLVDKIPEPPRMWTSEREWNAWHQERGLRPLHAVFDELKISVIQDFTLGAGRAGVFLAAHNQHDQAGANELLQAGVPVFVFWGQSPPPSRSAFPECLQPFVPSEDFKDRARRCRSTARQPGPARRLGAPAFAATVPTPVPAVSTHTPAPSASVNSRPLGSNWGDCGRPVSTWANASTSAGGALPEMMFAPHGPPAASNWRSDNDWASPTWGDTSGSPLRGKTPEMTPSVPTVGKPQKRHGSQFFFDVHNRVGEMPYEFFQRRNRAWEQFVPHEGESSKLGRTAFEKRAAMFDLAQNDTIFVWQYGDVNQGPKRVRVEKNKMQTEWDIWPTWTKRAHPGSRCWDFCPTFFRPAETFMTGAQKQKEMDRINSFGESDSDEDHEMRDDNNDIAQFIRVHGAFIRDEDLQPRDVPADFLHTYFGKEALATLHGVASMSLAQDDRSPRQRQGSIEHDYRASDRDDYTSRSSRGFETRSRSPRRTGPGVDVARRREDYGYNRRPASPVPRQRPAARSARRESPPRRPGSSRRDDRSRSPPPRYHQRRASPEPRGRPAASSSRRDSPSRRPGPSRRDYRSRSPPARETYQRPPGQQSRPPAPLQTLSSRAAVPSRSKGKASKPKPNDKREIPNAVKVFDDYTWDFDSTKLLRERFFWRNDSLTAHGGIDLLKIKTLDAALITVGFDKETTPWEYAAPSMESDPQTFEDVPDEYDMDTVDLEDDNRSLSFPTSLRGRQRRSRNLCALLECLLNAEQDDAPLDSVQDLFDLHKTNWPVLAIHLETPAFSVQRVQLPQRHVVSRRLNSSSNASNQAGPSGSTRPPPAGPSASTRPTTDGQGQDEAEVTYGWMLDEREHPQINDGWVIVVESPVAALLALRSECADLQALALKFAREGFRFSMPVRKTLRTSPAAFDVESYLSTARSSFVAVRPPEYQFTRQDFEAYERSRWKFFQENPRAARFALLRGGILWRLAVASLSPDDVLGGPSDYIAATEHALRACYRLRDDEIFEDRLLDEEEYFIIGRFHLRTGKVDTYPSFWPTDEHWQSSAYGQQVGWCGRAERWYVARRSLYFSENPAHSRDAQPVSSNLWTRVIGGLGHMKHVGRKLESLAEAFLESRGNSLHNDPSGVAT
jgi:hypothetical protein